MGFDNPWMLLGMLAGAVPVVIHLINRQRAKLTPFAAIEFLLLSDKRLARRLKLKQLLVLLLRVALLMALAFALSKPYVEPEVATAPDVTAPGAVVLVVDDSMSMGAAVPGAPDTTLLDAAREQAERIVASGGSRTSFAVVTASEPARVLTPALTYERTAIDRALERLEPTSRGSDMAGALREAERLLAESQEPTRQVVVLSDQAAHAWRDVDQPWALSTIPTVRRIDLREGAGIPNVAIRGVTVRPAPELGAGKVEVVVEAQNFSDEPRDATVKVQVAGELLAGKLTVPARSEAAKTFVEALALDGATRGQARLEPTDALPADDVWHFTVDFGGHVNVLVVNGAPNDVPYRDELFFLKPALQPADGKLTRLRVITRSVADFARRPLDAVDVVILANVGKLSPAQYLSLKAFVEQGGGLLVTAGDQLTEASNRSLGELLALPIRDVQTVARRDDPGADLKSLRVDHVDFEHPIVRDFVGLEEASLFRARVYTYALLAPRPQLEAKVVASFTGGVPALVERRLGRGRVMLWTSSIDRDWTDLPIRTSYLPLVQQMTLHLAGRLQRDGSAGDRVGEVVTILPPAGSGPLELRRPDGEQIEIPAPDEGEAITITDTGTAGVYTLSRSTDPAAVTAFAVNAPRTESDLAPADPAALDELLAKPGAGRRPAVARGDGGVTSSPPNRTDLWPPVLVALFVLLISETWLVLRS